MPKQWITTNTATGDGYWQDFTPQTKDVAAQKFFANAQAPLTPDAGTTPKIASYNGVPMIEFVSGGKTYYMQPALGLNRANGVYTDDAGNMQERQDYSIDPTYWQSYSNYDRWSGNTAGLPVMRADWASNLVNASSPYVTGGADYAGGGWVSDKPIPRQDWQATKDESALASFMQGPAIPLGAFLTAGALSGWSPGVGGELAFDPTLDFGGSYFDGAGQFVGGAGGGGVPFDPAAYGDLQIGSDMMNFSGMDPATAGDFSIGADMRAKILETPGGQEWFNRIYPNGGVFGPGAPNNVPVEDRSKPYDPNSQAGSNNPLSIAKNLATIGKESVLGGGMGGGASGTSELGKLRQNLSIASAVGSVLSGLSTPSQGEFAQLSRASDAGRRQVVNANLKQLDDAFKGFDDAYFNSVANAFKNYYQPQVNDTFDEATRKTIYRAPGGVGSTAFAENLGKVERDRQLADVAVGEQAAGEAQRARQTVEANRAALTGLAESSEDPGAFGAQAVATAKASAATPSYNPLADLFSRYAMLAANAGAAESAGYGGNRSIYAGGGGYGSGGSKGSVKTVWN